MMKNEIESQDFQVEGILDSLEQLYEMIRNIKANNRHFVSNAFMNEDDLLSYIKDKSLKFDFVKDSYLNLYKREWDFDRMYFYIADISKYRISSKRKVIADVLFRKANRDLDLLRDKMKLAGFYEYAYFGRYIGYNVIADSSNNTVFIKKEVSDGFYELLKKCFDRYTDYIPEDKDIDLFFDSHVCYSAKNNENKLIGGVVLSVKGKTVTEEFIFVHEDFRKRGLSNQIRDYWISDMSSSVTKYISWIRDNNEPSRKYLLNNGFIKDNAVKITMLKG